jgi:integrase
MAAKPRNIKSRQDTPTADAHERAKNFLTEAEMDKLLAAARKGRHGVRDHLLMLMMYRHGLRVSEAVALRRDHVNVRDGRLWVSRLKGSLSTEHRIDGAELRGLKRTSPVVTTSSLGSSCQNEGRR